MSQPSAGDAVELLKAALAEGHTVVLSLTSPPRIMSSSEPPPVVSCCEKFGLAPTEGRAFVALLKHAHVSKENLHAAISGNDPTTDIKIVGVTIHGMRKKLLRHGIEIVSLYGFGYRLGHGSHARARELLAGHDIDIADPTTQAEKVELTAT